MSSYKNSKGETINVCEKHINTSILIKKELQNASPSRRCNWSQHKKLMEKEGFFDSDINENYRCLIKDEQKKRGELPSLEKHVDIISSNKLQSIKELVGELAFEKRENQLVLNELNKVKREVIDYSLIAEQIGKAFKDIEINIIDDKDNIVENTEREMLVLPADWHVGYIDNKYNYKEAKLRIDKYVDKIEEYANIFNINKFHLTHLGDIIENLYMHKNSQSFNAEFTLSEQIVKATELLFYLITRLAQIGNVYFHGVVRGNHGRMSAKGETILKDCAEYIVHENIKSIMNVVNSNRMIIDDEGYNIERSLIVVKGKKIKAIHGDFEGQNDREKIQKHISLENELIDILALGHFHHFNVKVENHGRIVYGSGCLQGATEYGFTLKYNTPASQGIIIIGENNEVIPIDIPLE